MKIDIAKIPGINRIAVRFAVALAAGLSASIVLLAAPEARAEGLLSAATKFLSPGELTAPHSREEKLEDCYACHTLTRGIDDALCLDCHKVIGEKLASRNGYHGTLEGRCQECHTDHKGLEADIVGLDASAFNHRLSNYSLTGKHAEADCDKCHPPKKHDKERADAAQTRYIDIGFDTCEKCHEDPHVAGVGPEGLGKDCAKCHTTDGWSGRALEYSHMWDSKYKLLGKHQAVSCEKCHRGPEPESQFRLPGASCSQCHADEHEGKLSKQCETCHGEFGWKGAFLSFDHDKQSSYKLDAVHARVACADCHRDKKYKPLDDACTACHGVYESIMAGRPPGDDADPSGSTEVGADPHWKRVRCDQCHDAASGEQRMALYQDKCVGCHNARYGPLLLDWMKAWFTQRHEVLELLRRAGKKDALSSDELDRFSQKLGDAEKIGAHNFRLAPLEWEALRADIERAIPSNRANASNASHEGIDK